MEIVLNICLSDGSEIGVDGFDTISFHNEVQNIEIIDSGYTWERDLYLELLNNLAKYKFIGITRNDPKDDLVYREHHYAYRNEYSEKNKTLILQTSAVTTIIALNQ